MSETYTGWDGKPYPWPPPEGWYEASDGRWWAPGTGPNPPGAEGPGGVPGTAAAPPEQPTVAADVARTAQLPADLGPADRGAAAIASGVTVASDTSTGATPPPALGGAAGGHGGDDWTNQWDQTPEATPGGAGQRSRLATIGLVLAGVAAALVVAAGAYFVLRDDGNETAAEGGETSTDDSVTDDGDNAGDTEEGATDTDEGAGDETDDTSDDATTTTDGNSTDPTDDSTSTTDDETTTTSDGSSTTADASTQVNEFRGILSDNGLTSDGLSDDDIATFGTRFCVFAIASESQTEYEDFRRQAIETTNSELTDDELFTVVDAAVAVFCPDEAQRLGIEL